MKARLLFDDRVILSKAAFADLTFDKKGPRSWDIIFKDRAAYLTMVGKVQREQIARGGARLAELLKAIWPQ